MNQIEFIDNLPLEEVQSGLSYPGLITVRRSGVQTLRKRILPTQSVLSSDIPGMGCRSPGLENPNIGGRRVAQW